MLFFSCLSHIYVYLCTRNKQSTKLRKNSQIDNKKGLVAQLNSALDYGSRGYWFESSRGHKSQMAPIEDNWRHFLIYNLIIVNELGLFLFYVLFYNHIKTKKQTVKKS